MQLRFRTKLLASHVALVAAVVLIAILELNRSLGADLEGQLDRRLEQQALGAAGWVGEGRRHPDKLVSRLALVVNADVTILDHNGVVVAESVPGAFAASSDGNDGAKLPEIVAARNGEVGRAARARPDTGEVVHYVAVAATDGQILRIAAPLSGINATLGGMRQRLLFASALALVAALALGFLASRVAARPLRAMTQSATRIAQGDYDIEVPPASPDEFGILSRTLGSLAKELKARIGDLTAERDRLTAILAGMIEGVVVIGADGDVVVANPAAKQILGVETGARAPDAVADPAIRAFVAEAMKGDETREGEVTTKTTPERSIAIYVRPARAPNMSGGVVVVVRDMTRLRRLLTMRQDFVANVSHELRTPVTAIQGYAETLLRGKSLDEQTARQFLEIIHRQAYRLGVLVEGLLRLSEIEARAPEQAVRERIDVPAVARHVVETVRDRSAQANVRVKLELEGDATALGDPGGLEQVVENLVDNAIKYGRQGGEVTIRGRRDGDRVVLTVADDGPGIEPRHLPRLFERFYRVDPGRSRDKGGTGLGLAIVKHLVESMGGNVEVASDVGKGSRFTVGLPAA